MGCGFDAGGDECSYGMFPGGTGASRMTVLSWMLEVRMMWTMVADLRHAWVHLGSCPAVAERGFSVLHFSTFN